MAQRSYYKFDCQNFFIQIITGFLSKNNYKQLKVLQKNVVFMSK